MTIIYAHSKHIFFFQLKAMVIVFTPDVRI
jgi:hypothetical protein